MSQRSLLLGTKRLRCIQIYQRRPPFSFNSFLLAVLSHFPSFHHKQRSVHYFAWGYMVYSIEASCGTPRYQVSSAISQPPAPMISAEECFCFQYASRRSSKVPSGYQTFSDDSPINLNNLNLRYRVTLQIHFYTMRSSPDMRWTTRAQPHSRFGIPIHHNTPHLRLSPLYFVAPSLAHFDLSPLLTSRSSFQTLSASMISFKAWKKFQYLAINSGFGPIASVLTTRFLSLLGLTNIDFVTHMSIEKT